MKVFKYFLALIIVSLFACSGEVRTEPEAVSPDEPGGWLEMQSNVMYEDRVAGGEDVEITLRRVGLTEGEIYYTIDGSVPTEEDTLYSEPITLTGSEEVVWIRAALFNKGILLGFAEKLIVFKVEAPVLAEDGPGNILFSSGKQDDSNRIICISYSAGLPSDPSDTDCNDDTMVLDDGGAPPVFSVCGAYAPGQLIRVKARALSPLTDPNLSSYVSTIATMCP